jgi:hypothetical protein
MADSILTESKASLVVEDLGWRYLLDCLTTAVALESLFDVPVGAPVARGGD